MKERFHNSSKIPALPVSTTEKGNCQSFAGKILALILLNRVIQHFEQGLLPENQCGFRSECGTADMIFAARQFQEKCQRQNSHHFVTFVDLTKAFDTVRRDGLWKIMENSGCLSKTITIVQQFHVCMIVKFLDDRDESEAFLITKGANKAAFWLRHSLECIFSATQIDSFHDRQNGIPVRYRTEGGLFNLRRLMDVIKVKETVIRDFLFAADYMKWTA